ncbi:hypothetical protein LXL04_001181 [Taraxacum kok-saghyz]
MLGFTHAKKKEFVHSGGSPPLPVWMCRRNMKPSEKKVYRKRGQRWERMLLRNPWAMASLTEEPLHPRTVAVPVKMSPIERTFPNKMRKIVFPTNPLDAYRIRMYQAIIRSVDDYNLGYFVTIHEFPNRNPAPVCFFFTESRFIDCVSPPDRKGDFAREAWDAVVAKCLWVELEDMVVYSTVNGQMSMVNSQQCTPLDLHARSAATDNPI